MKYDRVPPIDKNEAREALSSDEVPRIADALVRSAYHIEDWRWVQANCLRMLDHENEEVKMTAATCLGHLARIHGILDTAIVIPKLQELLLYSNIKGRIEDALDDIRMFATETDE